MEQAIGIAWTLIQRVIPHQIWLHRNAAAFQQAQDPAPAILAKTKKLINTQLRSLAAHRKNLGATRHLSEHLETIANQLNSESSNEPPADMDIWLYFDGGARGNPGTSGAGSLLVTRRRGEGWRVEWWAATYLGPTNTNNAAEHWGLAVGLDECRRRFHASNERVTIVGESDLILRQLQGRAMIRKDNLRRPQASQRALIALFDYEFRHVRRAGNTAADWLANHAMDKKYTITTRTTTALARTDIDETLQDLISSDVQHAFSAIDTHVSITATIQRLRAKLSQLTASKKRPPTTFVHRHTERTTARRVIAARRPQELDYVY